MQSLTNFLSEYLGLGVSQTILWTKYSKIKVILMQINQIYKARKVRTATNTEEDSFLFSIVPSMSLMCSGYCVDPGAPLPVQHLKSKWKSDTSLGEGWSFHPSLRVSICPAAACACSLPPDMKSFVLVFFFLYTPNMVKLCHLVENSKYYNFEAGAREWKPDIIEFMSSGIINCSFYGDIFTNSSKNDGKSKRNTQKTVIQ